MKTLSLRNLIFPSRYRRYGIKSLQESLEYETQQKARKLSRKKNEKIRNQQKQQGLNPSLQAPNLSSANVESPLGSIMSFEQSGMFVLTVY